MERLIISLVLLGLAMTTIVLKKTYAAVPFHELKRRAETGDQTAARLYKVTGYGASLNFLLWLVIALTSAASFILLAKLMPFGLSLVVVGLLIWITFSLVPAGHVSRAAISLARLSSPLLSYVLYYLHPVIVRITKHTEGRYERGTHTRLFVKEDLIKLVDKQLSQQDNRISKEEINSLKKALKFSQKKVGDYVMSIKKVKTVLASDTIGPILINELHETDQGQALVKESSKGEVVGTLAFKDLDIKSSGHVSDLMSNKVCYLNEDDLLSEALRAMISTSQTICVVVNSSAETLGVITLEHVVDELLGPLGASEIEDYSDKIGVAERYKVVAPEPSEDGESEETAVQPETEVIE